MSQTLPQFVTVEKGKKKKKATKNIKNDKIYSYKSKKKKTILNGGEDFLFFKIKPKGWQGPWSPRAGSGDGGRCQAGTAASHPNVFQPHRQANFNFLVIMQMNVDLIKGRFH